MSDTYAKIMGTGPQWAKAFEEVLDDIEKDKLKDGDYVGWLQIRLDRGKVLGLRGHLDA